MRGAVPWSPAWSYPLPGPAPGGGAGWRCARLGDRRWTFVGASDEGGCAVVAVMVLSPHRPRAGGRFGRMSIGKGEPVGVLSCRGAEAVGFRIPDSGFQIPERGFPLRNPACQRGGNLLSGI